MAAVKSDNPLHAEMNMCYTINVWEWSAEKKDYVYAGIASANEVSVYIGNEQLKIRLFNEVLDSGMKTVTKKIRERLKLKFYSK